MICISLSEEFVRFGQLIKTDEGYSIGIVRKKNLSIPFTPKNITNPQLSSALQQVFQEIRTDLPVPDRYVAIALPAEWFDLSRQEVDSGLSRENIEEALKWNATQRLGPVADQKFIQHYLLQRQRGSGQEYLSVSYFKDLGKLFLNAAQPSGFNIHIMDVNILSAASALERLEQIGSDEKWAVWLVGEQKHSLLVIDSGEFRQLVRFEFSDLENYTILSSTSSDDIGEKVVAGINGIRSFEAERLTAVDRLYYYSHEVESEFFNMLLTYGLENMKTIDPFENHKPVDLYEDDGYGIGAMCQFIDLMGLMIRKMPGGV
ncbi:MAG: hypothetical protein L6422_04600 [Candidatus Marinimicrobia bacterium]|nr:hypothetical protein [Candidatus Neomarinimicrobiota bacterium]